MSEGEEDSVGTKSGADDAGGAAAGSSSCDASSTPWPKSIVTRASPSSGAPSADWITTWPRATNEEGTGLAVGASAAPGANSVLTSCVEYTAVHEGAAAAAAVAEEAAPTAKSATAAARAAWRRAMIAAECGFGR